MVAFTTWATNLAKDTNGSHPRRAGQGPELGHVRRVSVNSKEQQSKKNSFSPVISGNGRLVSFQTFGSYGAKDQDIKEDVYVRDLRKGTTRQASLFPGTNKDIPGPMLNGDISDDGSKVVFGKNHKLWVRDMAAGKTTLFHSRACSRPPASRPRSGARDVRRSPATAGTPRSRRALPPCRARPVTSPTSTAST